MRIGRISRSEFGASSEIGGISRPVLGSLLCRVGTGPRC